MNHETIVDILDVLYVKLIRLKTAHRTCLSFILSPDIQSRYPDIVYSIKYSFAVDAYTTMNAVLTSGKYSFLTLKKESVLFGEKFIEAQARINMVCSCLQKRRNSMFCHCNEKQCEDYINDIVHNFASLMRILTELHGEAMHIFNVAENEIRVISSDKFNNLDAEFQEFMQGLQEVTMNRFYDELNAIIGNSE